MVNILNVANLFILELTSQSLCSIFNLINLAICMCMNLVLGVVEFLQKLNQDLIGLC